MVLIKKKPESAAEATKVVPAPTKIAEAKGQLADAKKEAAKVTLPQKRKIPTAVKKATDKEINAPTI